MYVASIPSGYEFPRRLVEKLADLLSSEELILYRGYDSYELPWPLIVKRHGRRMWVYKDWSKFRVEVKCGDSATIHECTTLEEAVSLLLLLGNNPS